MLETVILGFLALAGIACTAILGFVLVRSGWRLDQRRADRAEVAAEADDRDDIGFEPWALAAPPDVQHDSGELLSIMREHFPAEYARYREGALAVEERRWVRESCRAIADARVEIEEICG